METMPKLKQSLYVQIEESINRRHSMSIYRLMKVDTNETRLQDAFASRLKQTDAADYILAQLPKRGFALPDGQPDCPKFYHYAMIGSDVWSTFLSRRHKPSKDTLLKIVVALRFNEEEARYFLSLAGSGFSNADPRDMLLLACMDCGCMGVEEVYEVLERYSKMTLTMGRRIVNLY